MLKLLVQVEVNTGIWFGLAALNVQWGLRIPAILLGIIRTPPIEPGADFEMKMRIPVADIIDWQIELPDGNLRGAFTTQAMFKIFERQQGYMHPKFAKHMRRFQDPLTAETG